MKLEREQIVRAALRLLNEVGLEGLTLRRIATALDVQAPALYWHFRNKQALLDEMATTIMRDHLRLATDDAPDTSLQNWLRAYAHGLRGMLLEYRDGAKMFSGTLLTDPDLYAGMEQHLRVLTRAGLSLDQAMAAGATIYSFVIGATIEEQAVFPRPGERSPQYDLATRAGRIDRERFPLAHASGDLALNAFDARFAEGLEIIIAGVEQRYPEPASSG